MCEVAQRFAGWIGLGPGCRRGSSSCSPAGTAAGSRTPPGRRSRCRPPPARGERHLALPLGRGIARRAGHRREPGGHGLRPAARRPGGRALRRAPRRPRRGAHLGGGARCRAVAPDLGRRRADRRRVRGHRRAHRPQVAVAARALDQRGRACGGGCLANGPRGRRRNARAARRRLPTTSAAWACRTRSGRSRARWASGSGSACGCMRTSPSGRSRSRSTLAAIGELAGSHHERLDGSGYHRGSRGTTLDQRRAHPRGGRLLRRDARGASVPARARRRRGRGGAQARGEEGCLDAEAIDAVLAAAGHRVPKRPRELPAG